MGEKGNGGYANDEKRMNQLQPLGFSQEMASDTDISHCTWHTESAPQNPYFSIGKKQNSFLFLSFGGIKRNCIM